MRSYNHLREFVQRKCGQEDITLRSLDREFYDAFDLFLRTECRLQQKSVHEHLYRLKKMTARAVNQERCVAIHIAICTPNYRNAKVAT